MLFLPIVFQCYESHWTAARSGGQPGSSTLCLPMHDNILARRGPETSAPWHWLSVTTSPRLLEMKISLSERATSPAWQRLSNKAATSDQTNDGWLAPHASKAGFTQESRVFMLQKVCFNPLVTPVKSCSRFYVSELVSLAISDDTVGRS